MSKFSTSSEGIARHQSDNALLDDKKQIAAILESALDGIITIDVSGRVVLFNSAAERIFGHSADKMIGSSIDVLIPKRFQAAYRDYLATFAQTKGSIRTTDSIDSVWGVRANGEEFPIEASISTVGSGAASLFTIILRDVTERHRVEEALTKSRERFLKAFRASSSPASITTLDEGRYIDVNDSFLRAVERSRDEVIGHTAGELGIWSNPGRRDEIVERLKAGMPVHNLELRYQSKTGREGVWLLSADVIELDGQLCIIGYRNDITDRKKAEEELRRQTETLRQQTQLLDNAQVLVYDNENRIIFWNLGAERLFGWKKEEALGRSTHDLLGTEFSEPVGKVKAKLLAEGHWEGELTHTRRDGTRLTVMSHQVLHRDTDGHPIAIVEADNDITELKRAHAEIARLNTELEERVRQRTAQLEASNRELESFSYSVSHDLRAPLRSIDGFSKALLEDYGDGLDTHGRNYLDRIRAATQNMGELIDDLLELSRVTRAEIRRQPIDLSSMARSITNELRRSDPMRDVRVDIEDGLVAVGDRRLIRIVLENLLSNSWKFTAKQRDQHIEVRDAGKNGKTVFLVRDNGAGFDMNYADKLFGAFQRLHSAKEFPGTGVGLATVHRIINRHGGRVWAESEVGKGATFYFTL